MSTMIHKSIRRLVPASAFLVVLAGSTIYLNYPLPASAHTGTPIVATCGKATIDGNVGAAEWSGAARTTFQMVSGSAPVPFTATLYIMNSLNSLYIGITINDEEFSTIGNFLPEGDGFRIDFDNDHSGSLHSLNDDVLLISAGLPQFQDSYVYNTTVGSSQSDLQGGGSEDGQGAAARVEELNHFELKHPICSTDALDFCLNPASASTVGFRLEYLDAQANGDFGGTQFYPGTGDTAAADIVITNCSIADNSIFLPLIAR